MVRDVVVTAAFPRSRCDLTLAASLPMLTREPQQDAAEVVVPSLYSRATSVEAAPMQNETILFNPGTGGFCVLNPSAALVWNSLETPQPAEVLAAQLCATFQGVTAAQAMQDVEAVLNEFRTLSLVELQS